VNIQSPYTTKEILERANFISAHKVRIRLMRSLKKASKSH